MIPLDYLEELSAIGRQDRRPGAGDAGHADPEDAGARSHAWLRYRDPDRADQQRCVPGKSRFLVPGLSATGALGVDQKRMAGDGEQPSREILYSYRPGTQKAEVRDRGVGTADRRHR